MFNQSSRQAHNFVNSTDILEATNTNCCKRQQRKTTPIATHSKLDEAGRNFQQPKLCLVTEELSMCPGMLADITFEFEAATVRMQRVKLQSEFHCLLCFTETKC